MKSACFDSRLTSPAAPVVPFHILNPKDPGTRLLVEGTESVFTFLTNLYLAIKRDSRSMMYIHEFYKDVAKHEVKLLEELWQSVIINAKQTLATVEEAYAERLTEDVKDEALIHSSICQHLEPRKPRPWRRTLTLKRSVPDLGILAREAEARIEERLKAETASRKRRLSICLQREEPPLKLKRSEEDV